MIPSHQSESVMPVVALIISIFSLVVTIAGWFVVDLLSRRRDRQRDSEARKRDFDSVVSDFEACVNKWLGIINDRQHTALAGERTKSLPEIEPVMRKVRAYLSDIAKGRLDDQWEKYKSIPPDQLKPDRIPPGVGTSARDDYAKPRNTLSEPLKKMMEIIRDTY